ncbi:MAG: ATP-binding protein [Anaerolineae bacterium]|jgi:predicted kinase
MAHRYVIISGAPGAGKSQLGRTLSQRLGWPLLSKDVIKEALADGLGMGDAAWSSRLSGAAMEVLHQVARSFPAAILDANFKQGRDLHRLAALPGQKVEIFCHAPAEVIAERIITRATSDRHPIHRDAMDPERMAQEVRELVRTLAPLDLGVPTLSLDTSLSVDEEATLAWVRTHLELEQDRDPHGGRVT